MIIKDLSFSYGEKQILNNINFEVQKGTLLCVLGSNGAGKTTLFKCILGLHDRDKYSGSILINGHNIKGLNIKKLAKQVAYIPQSHNPTFDFDVIDVVLMSTGVWIRDLSSPGEKQKKIAYEALDRIGIGKLAHRGYAKISGGERQLVLIARALAQQTNIIIMDEPTANLDYGNQIRVLSQVRKLAQEGYTIIQSTHNPDQAFLYATHALVLNEGKIAVHGSPKEIITEGMIEKIYGVKVGINSLYNDEVRVCIPLEEIKKSIF